MHNLYLDIESFSEVDLPKTGVYPYANDASTEVLMIGYAFDEEPVEVWVPDNPASTIPPELAHRLLLEDVTIHAHNSEFDRLVLSGPPGEAVGFPQTPPERWNDTMCQCYYNGLPGKLDHALKALDMEMKDKRGGRLVHKFMKPRKPSKLNKSLRWGEHNAPEDWAAFIEYCRQDVNVLRNLHKRLKPLPPLENDIRLLTNRMNTRGVLIDQATVGCALEIIGQLTTDLEIEVMQLTGGLKSSQRAKMLVWLLEHGVDMKESWSAANVEFMLSTEIEDPAARRVLEVRSTLSKTSTKKLQTMVTAALPDGRVRGTVQYGGAYRTLRWAGRLLQTHNFPRGTLKPQQVDAVIGLLHQLDIVGLREYGNPLQAIASTLRALIFAPPGHTLYVSDYSAIEARVLAWLCHQKDGLQEFHDGLDTYKIMAGVIYNKPASKVTDDERKVGKDTVLGCGYNMGAPTFKRQINDRGGDQIDDELAQLAVNSYREKNNKIAKFWEKINKCAKYAILDPDVQKTISCLTFEYDTLDDTLIMGLPSGRALHYPQPRIESGRTPWGAKTRQIKFGSMYNNAWVRESTYGGKLTENAAQAIARDLMANGMLEAEKEGFDRIIMTVHDELIAEVPLDFDKTIEDFSVIISRLPDWAKSDGGIPLVAEGFKTKRYSKSENPDNWVNFHVGK